MIRKLLLAAAAVATLATGTIADSSNSEAGINITISGPGYGHGYGSPWYGSRHGHNHRYGRGYGYRSSSYWGGPRHDYRPYRPHCRWRVKRVKVSTWDAYNNCWVTRKVSRRYRTCF